jgi:murein DD-endopeptidase MepM/ murein hydrolase activator NlpD
MSAYSYDETIWEEEDWPEDGYLPLPASGLALNPALPIVAALAAFALFALLMLRTGFSTPGSVAAPQPTAVALPGPAENSRLPDSVMPLAPESFAAPYTEYWITQGLHGFSYGHMAIDIAAGEGEPVLSPIAGQVTRKNTDGYGNPVLVIENEVYRVTLLHGIYSVEVGEIVNQGSVVGEESNIGYTTDMQGRLCAGRDCGFHTHLNVFDKRVGGNVNPLDLLE